MIYLISFRYIGFIKTSFLEELFFDRMPDSYSSSVIINLENQYLLGGIQMDGIELAKRVREINPECKILFISGYSEVDHLKSIIALHAVDFVEKPVEITLLESRLKEAVEAQRMQRLRQVLLSESLVQSLNDPVPVSVETFVLLRRAAGQVEMNTPCCAFLVKPVTKDGRAVTDTTLFSVMGQLATACRKRIPARCAGFAMIPCILPFR